jgi:hypothetical protein
MLSTESIHGWTESSMTGHGDLVGEGIDGEGEEQGAWAGCMERRKVAPWGKLCEEGSSVL